MMPFPSGDRFTRAFATARESTPAMKTVMVSTKCMSIRWKASGRCCALGCAHIAAFLRKSCRFTWGSLSSYTMSDGVAGPCRGHFWTRYCNQWHVLKTQYEPHPLQPGQTWLRRPRGGLALFELSPLRGKRGISAGSLVLKVVLLDNPPRLILGFEDRPLVAIACPKVTPARPGHAV